MILSDVAVTMQLRVLTGPETSVGDGAGLRIIGPPGVEFERPGKPLTLCILTHSLSTITVSSWL